MLDKDGKPVYLSWEGAEKMDVDYELTVTNAGGHSSAPIKDNAIYELSDALLESTPGKCRSFSCLWRLLRRPVCTGAFVCKPPRRGVEPITESDL